MGAFRWWARILFRNLNVNDKGLCLSFLKRTGKRQCFQDIISTADVLIQFKFIYHLHYTPARLVTIGPGRDIACARCKMIATDLFHMFWTCPGLTTFWKDVFSFFNRKLHVPLPQTPEVGLLGVLNDIVPRTHVRMLIRILCTKDNSIALERYCPPFRPCLLPYCSWDPPKI